MTTFRVLLCVASLDQGGAERQMLVLARGLAALPGVQVRLALIHGGGALEAQADPAWLHHLTPSTTWRRQDVPRATLALWRLCRAYRPHAVYGFEPLVNQMAAAAALGCGARVFWGIRCSLGDESDFSPLQKLARRVEAWLSPLAHGIVSNSRKGADDHVDRGYDARRMHVIRNGVDTRCFAPDATAGLKVRAELGLAPEHEVVGLVARHVPIKDIPTFLAAARMVRDTRPDVRFVCAGRGFGGAEAERELRRHGLGPEVARLDFHPDMPSLYNAFTCNVLSSRAEGLPNVLLEGMACGVPCACTDAGDSAFAVGGTGMVSPVGDAAALARNTLTLLDEARLRPEAWAQRQEAARQRAVTEFGVDVCIAKTHELLRNAGSHHARNA